MNLLAAILAVLSGLIGDADRDVACLMLGGLDSVRAAAFAAGDDVRLARVYASDDVAGPDTRLVRGYRRRGLTVDGAVLHRDRCDVASKDARRIELDVTDRLGAAEVVWPDGRRRELPRDLPTRHVVQLTRTPHGWRISGVR